MKKPSTLLLRLIMFTALFAAAGAVKAQIYCSPSYGTPCNIGGDFIQSFSTTGGTTNITNNNTGCNGSANNYLYYPTQTVTTAAGSSFNFSFTNSGTQQYYKIWVDWNNNLSFTDPGEEVYASTSNVAASAVVTGTVAVPAGTSAGTKRLRIRSQFFTSPVTSCGNALYGETEDYNVQVGGSVVGCGGLALIDTAYVVTGNACASSNLTLSLYIYSASPTIAMQWQYSTGAPASAYTNIAGATTTPVTVQGMAGYYRAAITCLATGQTFMSAPVYVGALMNCQDSVWSGDANYDLVANNLDFLAVTTSWGNSGPARSGASNAWAPQFAMNWPQTFSNAVNKKNADCDGDGIIGWTDTVAISQNYGQVHLRGAGEDEPTEKTAGLPDLVVDLTGLSLMPGTTITAPIRFGNAANPVTKIYGAAATVKLSGTATVGAPSVAINAPWMGTLGTVTFSIPANATGKVKVSLQNVRLIDSTGAVLTAYNVVADSANITTTGIGTTNEVSSATVSPNPGSASTLQFQLQNPASVEICIVDALGRKVWETTVRADGSFQRIALPQLALPTGVYSVGLRVEGVAQTQHIRWAKQ